MFVVLDRDGYLTSKATYTQDRQNLLIDPAKNTAGGLLKFIETEDELGEFMKFREKKAKEKLNANNG